MSDGGKISKDQYLYYFQIGVPYEGEVEGLGHAFTKNVATSYAANKSGTAHFYNVNCLNICVIDTAIVANTNLSNNQYSKDKEEGGWIQRGDHIFYDREISSQAGAEKTYGKKAKYLPEGSKIEGYTLHNENKGTVKDKEGIVVDNSTRIHAGQYIIFGTCDTCLNAGTLYKNWFFKSCFIGPNNPKVYADDSTNPWSYDFAPKRWSEYPAIIHDKMYDKLELAGPIDALFATKAIGADIGLVVGETIVFVASPNLKEKLTAATVAVGYSLIVQLKVRIWVVEKTIDAAKATMDAAKATKDAALDFYIKANAALESAVFFPLKFY